MKRYTNLTALSDAETVAIQTPHAMATTLVKAGSSVSRAMEGDIPS